MNESIVVQLTSECFKVPSIEVLGENSLGKDRGRMYHQKALSPFHETVVLFSLEHVMQTTDELIESSSTLKGGEWELALADAEGLLGDFVDFGSQHVILVRDDYVWALLLFS